MPVYRSPAPATRDKVFISYSHKDERWLQRVRNFLCLLELQGKVLLWDDTRIASGTIWEKEIRAALETTRAAVLLISKDFLDSTYIRKKELPILLAAALRNVVDLFLLIIRSAKIPPRLSQFQYIPRIPLEKLPIEQQEQALSRLVRDIVVSLTDGKSGPGPIPFYISSAFPSVDYELSGRSHLLETLDRTWHEGQARVITIVAPGGIGKTSLVNHWLQDLAQKGWCGARRVFVWSFYSQGSHEGKQVSSEPFLHAAFKFFGLGELGRESAWDKGQLLARQVQAERTLLVLDGLETLQEPAPRDRSAGRLRDQAVLSLLHGLANGAHGLVVVTTRVPIADLERCHPDLCPRLDLKKLDQASGAELLRRWMPQPGLEEWRKPAHARISGRELRLAAKEFDGHPLALRLLAGYLASILQGDILRWKEIGPALTTYDAAGHARQMMRQYEKAYAKDPHKRPALDILYMVGLFDRPCPPGAVDALRAGDIPDLTQRIRRLDSRGWARCLALLTQAGLLNKESDGSLDCHPLVREYFGRQLKARHPRTWNAAQSTLFDYFRKLPGEFLPRTWNELEALFQAVACGCQAGRYQEARKLYELRVVGWNDHGTPRHQGAFALRRFGASNLYLSALYHFFERPWTKPCRHLTTSECAFVLHEAGHYLFLLGRLRDSIAPLKLGMKLRESLGHYGQASTAARLIREVYLYLGKFKEAQDYAGQGIDLADRSGSLFHRMGLRAAKAQVLFYHGDLDEAARFFAEAEKIEKTRRPKSPFLAFVWGFWYCELLLERARRLLEGRNGGSDRSRAEALLRDVQRRATRALALAERIDSIFEIAHDHQTLGETLLLRSRFGGKHHSKQAAAHLDQAVEGLRKTGQQHHLVSALLARAELHRTCRRYKPAEIDLEEAKGIADRSEMVIHQIDVYLEYVRLRRAQRRLRAAKASQKAAQVLIRKTGYHRHEPEF